MDNLHLDVPAPHFVGVDVHNIAKDYLALGLAGEEVALGINKPKRGTKIYYLVAHLTRAQASQLYNYLFRFLYGQED